MSAFSSYLRQAAQYVDKNGFVTQEYYEYPDSDSRNKMMVPEEDCPACAIGAYAKVVGYSNPNQAYSDFDFIIYSMSDAEGIPVGNYRIRAVSNVIEANDEMTDKSQLVGFLNGLADAVEKRGR